MEEYQGDVIEVLPKDVFTWLMRHGMDLQERRVIIITTVRSSRDYINYDLRYTLGFVANPRRFNGTLLYTLLSPKWVISCLTLIPAFVPVLFVSIVAVTRAKALLIIVGDPLVLGLDPLWREYLNTVHAGGGWRGRPIPWDPSEPVDPEGGYDVDLRMRALDGAGALAERLGVLDGDDFDAGPGEDQQLNRSEE